MSYAALIKLLYLQKKKCMHAYGSSLWVACSERLGLSRMWGGPHTAVLWRLHESSSSSFWLKLEIQYIALTRRHKIRIHHIHKYTTLNKPRNRKRRWEWELHRTPFSCRMSSHIMRWGKEKKKPREKTSRRRERVWDLWKDFLNSFQSQRQRKLYLSSFSASTIFPTEN